MSHLSFRFSKFKVSRGLQGLYGDLMDPHVKQLQQPLGQNLKLPP